MRVTIFSDLISKYSRLIQVGYDVGDPRSESLYLDLHNGVIYFELRGRLQGKLCFEMDSNEIDKSLLPAFWVNLPTFLSLVKEYDFFEYDIDDGVFYKEKEHFNLSILEEPFSSVDFSDFKDNSNKYEFITSESDNIIFNILKAYSFTGEVLKEGRNYKGVCLIKDKVGAANGFNMYEAENSVDVGEDPILLNIQTGPIFRDLEIIRMYVNGNRIYFTDTNEEIILYTPMESNLFYPQLTDKSFRNKFEHDTYISVNRKLLKEVIDFLNDFKKGDDSDVYITVEAKEDDDSSVYALLKTGGDKNRATRQISLLTASSELLDTPIRMHRESLSKGISLLNGDVVNLQMNSEAPAINIVGDGTDNHHLVTVRVKE